MKHWKKIFFVILKWMRDRKIQNFGKPQDGDQLDIPLIAHFCNFQFNIIKLFHKKNFDYKSSNYPRSLYLWNKNKVGGQLKMKKCFYPQFSRKYFKALLDK